MPSGAKRWCFTLNNPTTGERQLLSELGESEHVSYMVYGNEVGSEGTPHLQGYVQFANRRSMRQAKALLGARLHLEISRGTPRQASQYCKKDGDFVEHCQLEELVGQACQFARLRDWLLAR